jgi:5'-nucleotidase
MKKIVYIDMDNTLCDFIKERDKRLLENPKQIYPQSQWGFFLKLEPLEDAIESFNLLKEHYDVWILTRPSFRNVNSFTEKAQWVWDYLGYDIVEKTIMCGDKSLLKGDILIDDDDQAGQPKFEGEWIRFGTEPYKTWKEVIEHLIKNPL